MIYLPVPLARPPGKSLLDICFFKITGKKTCLALFFGEPSYPPHKSRKFDVWQAGFHLGLFFKKSKFVKY
jgi:hypothetical protein